MSEEKKERLKKLAKIALGLGALGAAGAGTYKFYSDTMEGKHGIPAGINMVFAKHNAKGAGHFLKNAGSSLAQGKFQDAINNVKYAGDFADGAISSAGRAVKEAWKNYTDPLPPNADIRINISKKSYYDPS